MSKNVMSTRSHPCSPMVHRGAFEIMPWPACREGVPTNHYQHTELPVNCRKCLKITN
jgi:hypothetical protein